LQEKNRRSPTRRQQIDCPPSSTAIVWKLHDEWVSKVFQGASLQRPTAHALSEAYLLEPLVLAQLQRPPESDEAERVTFGPTLGLYLWSIDMRRLGRHGRRRSGVEARPRTIVCGE